MTWVSPNSLPHDWDLERAWAVVNTLAEEAHIPVHIQHRLTACVCDLLSIASLARDLIALEIARSRNIMMTFPTLPSEESERAWRLHSAEIMLDGYRLAAVVKAFFFFVRSFHDAAYAVLLHATGGKTGKYTSLNDGIKKKETSLLRKVLQQELPGFVQWFEDIRDLRNDMKVGVGTGQGAKVADGVFDIHVNIQGIRNDPPVIDIVREVSSEDMEQALSQSARFMQFVAQTVESGKLPEVRT